MKKLLFILVAGILAMGCNQDVVEPTPDPTLLRLSDTSIEIDPVATERTVELTHNYAWESSVSSKGRSWLSMETGTSSDGVTTIIITAKENTSTLERSAEISFYSKEQEEVLTVTQGPVSGDVSTGSLEFDCTESIQYLTFETTASQWDVQTASGASWCDAEREEGTNRVAVSVKFNPADKERKTIVTISAGALTREVEITQLGTTLGVSLPSVEFTYEAQTQYVTVETVAPWEWSLGSSAGGWCVVEEGDDNRLSIIASKNIDAPRSTTLTITAGNLSRRVNISQDVLELEVSASELEFWGTGNTQSVSVTTNAVEWTWSVEAGVDWIIIEKTAGDQLSVTTTANNDPRQGREATISVDADGLSHEIDIRQFAGGSYTDKEVVKLHSATTGSGVNIVIMGDGYIASDMAAGGGKYETDMKTAMEHFFSVYPYNDHREYFNVWMVGAISNESGATVLNPRKDVDTVFKSRLQGGNSTGISCNSEIVREYTQRVVALTGKPLSEMTVIMPINLYVYAGTCSMWNNGFSISMCPVGPTYREIVVHEAGGHGFGKLMDEYRYYAQQYPNEANTQQWQEWGHYLNVDFNSDIRYTLWSGFAGLPEYSMVGTWEGAGLYEKGIWRSEYNSCMNNNVLYFNAQSRFVQMRRIHNWAGEQYTFEQFLQDDVIPPYPEEARARGEGVLAPFVPLAPPIMVEVPSNQF